MKQFIYRNHIFVSYCVDYHEHYCKVIKRISLCKKLNNYFFDVNGTVSVSGV